MSTPDFVVASDGGAQDAGGVNAVGSWSYVVADKPAIESIRAEISRVTALVGAITGAARTRLINKELRLDLPLLTGKGIIPGGTNNAGEITGALMGLTRVRGRGSVAWYTDSKYTLESVTKWCRGRSRTDKNYLNGDLIFALADLYDEMLLFGLVGRHIHSHESMPSDIEPAILWYLNHRADIESTAALLEWKKSTLGTSPAKPSESGRLVPWPAEMKFLLPFFAAETKVNTDINTLALDLYNVVNRTQLEIANVTLLKDALVGLINQPPESLESIFGGGVTTVDYSNPLWWKKINLELFDRWCARIIVLSFRV